MKSPIEIVHALMCRASVSIFIPLTLSCFLCSACAGSGVALEAPQPLALHAHDSVHHAQRVIDREIIHDSVIIETRHDTIYITKTKLVTKTVEKVDTIMISQIDTIFIREEVLAPEKKKEAPFLARISIFVKLVISILVLYAVYTIRKLLT